MKVSQSSDDASSIELLVAEQKFKTDFFVNKVYEYVPGKFVCAAWDNKSIFFIDYERNEVEFTIEQPEPQKAYGIAKIPHFDIIDCPFLLSRGNRGTILIDVKNRKAHTFSEEQISANLYGHGDLLRVSATAFDQTKVLTMVQDGAKAGKLVSLELPVDFVPAIKKLLLK